jgi:hypothetical protein
VSASATAAWVRRASRRELDEVFRRSPAGPIPVGRTRGTALIFPGSPIDGLVQRIARALFWKGKVFDPRTKDLRNLVSPLAVPAIRAMVYQDDSWFSAGRAIVLDYSKTSLLARAIRDEIRLVGPGVYLGQVFWGRTRLILFMLETVPSAPARTGEL